MWKYSGIIGNVRIEYSLDNGISWQNISASTINSGSYSWMIPQEQSDNCLIKISDINGEPSDISDALFSIDLAPSIIIISPNGGESLEAGSSHDITWTSTSNVKNLKIYYSTDNGAFWTTIESSTVNDGNYSWIVPDSPSDTCLIRISQSDADESASSISDNVFSIVPPASPSIILTTPNGSEILKTGSLYEINWTSFGNVGNVTIEYSINNGDSWVEIISTTSNDGIFEWTVPDTQSDNCLVRISETDGEPSDASNSAFSISSSSSGTITVTSPNSGESLTTGSTYEITWTSTGNIDNVIIEYSTDNGSSWSDIVISAINDGSYNWTVPETVSDNCLIRVSGGNEDTAPSDRSDEVFYIIPPFPGTITVTSPNGGENLIANSYHEIFWNSTGIIDYVNIEYSTDRGNSWTPIVQFAPNNGSYNWMVPDTPSDGCQIRIRRSEGDIGPLDMSDSVFSIIYI
jgi:exosome complex RNA-binding protein Rrp42 (RNase PH superfamily)